MLLMLEPICLTAPFQAKPRRCSNRVALSYRLIEFTLSTLLMLEPICLTPPFADTATFICSDRAGYITGSLIRCDGGLIRSV